MSSSSLINDVAISHEVSNVGFSFYSSEEIEKLSVKRITSSIAFDSLNNPIPGGLYDPAMGPVDNHVICPTCNLPTDDCPGHMGKYMLILYKKSGCLALVSSPCFCFLHLELFFLLFLITMPTNML